MSASSWLGGLAPRRYFQLRVAQGLPVVSYSLSHYRRLTFNCPRSIFCCPLRTACSAELRSARSDRRLASRLPECRVVTTDSVGSPNVSNTCRLE